MTSRRRYRAVFLTGARRLEIRETELERVAPGEVVVRIEAATTCGTDVKVYRRGGHPRMLTPPCPFGHEMTGRIEAIGEAVPDWEVGTAVVVANSASCGRCPACDRGRENLCHDLLYLNGAFAELVVVPERFVRRSLHLRPTGLDPVVAALAEPLACVLHGLERMRIDPTAGADGSAGAALVLGAGPIGLMFSHLLAIAGWRVTLEDRHDDRLALARRLGARHARRPGEVASPAAGSDFAVTIDATGTPGGWERAIAAVASGGTVNLFGGCAPGTRLGLDATRVHYDEIALLGSYHHRPATFRRALDLLARADCPLDLLITRQAPLDGVAEALEEMSARRALKVAIVPSGDSSPAPGPADLSA
ncbi:MAG: alcohol dehydrogenase catalytic domain-containing protein [Thermoanaerobaculia bacterium]|nr:alcohol dehydrogenase catalytic domain-containing protein [Thermoanaerobaculia bacterium]